MATDAPKIKVLSLNVLADCYVRVPDCPWINFEHCTNDALAWSARLPRLQALLRESDADVICLQEVQFEPPLCPPMVPSWLSEALAEKYVGIMQGDSKRAVTQRTGNATFFRSSRFEESAPAEHRCRSLIVWLRCKGDDKAILTVANCHLEGHPDKDLERVSQFRSVQRCIEVKSKANLPLATRAIVCGVFNSELDGTPLGAVALTGDSTGSSTWRNSAAAPAPPTWFVPGASLTIDHVLFCENGLAAEPSHIECDVAALRVSGLPSLQHPSDHLPVIAILRFVDCAQSTGAASAGGEIAALSEYEAAALELRWKEFVKQAPEKPQGKPTADQMVALNEHAAMVKAWLAALAPAAAELVKRFGKGK
jgi:endonuclease/exonuclease/phosphatase family metal-dependent hydrolase